MSLPALIFFLIYLFSVGKAEMHTPRLQVEPGAELAWAATLAVSTVTPNHLEAPFMLWWTMSASSTSLFCIHTLLQCKASLRDGLQCQTRDQIHSIMAAANNAETGYFRQLLQFLKKARKKMKKIYASVSKVFMLSISTLQLPSPTCP